METFDYYPLVETACLVAMNPEKAALYFSLAFVGGFLISVTVLCGHWMALKLAPIANDRSSMYSHQSTMTHPTPTHYRPHSLEQTMPPVAHSGCGVGGGLAPTVSHQSIMTQTSNHSSENGEDGKQQQQQGVRIPIRTVGGQTEQVKAPPQNPSYRLSFLEELRKSTEAKSVQVKNCGNPFDEEDDQQDMADSGKGQSLFGSEPEHRSDNAASLRRSVSGGGPGGAGSSAAASAHYAELNYDEDEEEDYEDYDQYYSDDLTLPPEHRHTRTVSVAYNPTGPASDRSWQPQQGTHLFTYRM